MAELLFRGIDFADQNENWGDLIIRDDGDALEVVCPSEAEDATLATSTAIDCPFGVSTEYVQLLNYTIPIGDHVRPEKFKGRATERWAGDHVRGFTSVQLWKNRNIEQKKEWEGDYFNAGSHIQPAAGLQIVPHCIWWIMTRLEAENCEERREQLINCRLGKGQFVEAHPRLFLYSAIERNINMGINQAANNVSDEILIALNHAKNYKKSEGSRTVIYEYLAGNTVWMGSERRSLSTGESLKSVVKSDHTFDAWLAALTAWAHYFRETITWEEIEKLSLEYAQTEGHILLLR